MSKKREERRKKEAIEHGHSKRKAGAKTEAKAEEEAHAKAKTTPMTNQQNVGNALE